jgi:hypothetical protein
MPSKHPRSSRMAARRTNFTSKSDLQSEGEFIHDEVSTMSSTDDAPTQSAPSPTRTPSTPSTNSASKSEEKSLAQIMATYGSPGSSSNPAVWGYGENTHSTPFTVQDAEEQFPRLQVVPTERSPPTSQQSTVSSSSALPHATPRFSLSPRRTRTPAPTPPAIVVKLDADTDTSMPRSADEEFPPSSQSVPINDYLHLIWSDILNELGVDPGLFFPMSAPFSTTQLIVDVSDKSSMPTALTALQLNSSSSINSSVSNNRQVVPIARTPLNNANDDDKNNGDASQPSGAPSANPPVPPPLPEPPPDAIVGDNAYTGEQSWMSIPMTLRIPSSAPSNPTPTQTHVAPRRRRLSSYHNRRSFQRRSL